MVIVIRGVIKVRRLGEGKGVGTFLRQKSLFVSKMTRVYILNSSGMGADNLVYHVQMNFHVINFYIPNPSKFLIRPIIAKQNMN